MPSNFFGRTRLFQIIFCFVLIGRKALRLEQQQVERVALGGCELFEHVEQKGSECEGVVSQTHILQA